MEIGDKQKRKILAAAEIIEKGEFAILEKIIELQDFLEDFTEKFEVLKQEKETDLESFKQNKSSELSSIIDELTSKLEEFVVFKENTEKMMENAKLGEEKHSEMMGKMQSEIDSISKNLVANIAEIKGMIPEMPEETDLTDIYNRLVEIENKIPKIPEEITSYQVRDKLESIDNESEKLKIEAIQNLREELDDLKKKWSSRPIFGGGYSVSAANLHTIDDETPAGTKNGVNTVFTIKHTPSPLSSLKVYVNGQRQRITDNFTFSGVTITFIDPPLSTDVILVDYRI
jgi:ferritin-like protein